MNKILCWVPTPHTFSFHLSLGPLDTCSRQITIAVIGAVWVMGIFMEALQPMPTSCIFPWLLHNFLLASMVWHSGGIYSASLHAQTVRAWGLVHHKVKLWSVEVRNQHISYFPSSECIPLVYTDSEHGMHQFTGGTLDNNPSPYFSLLYSTSFPYLYFPRILLPNGIVAPKTFI
jgi:hypothetical protein